MNANSRFVLGVACGVGLALVPAAAHHLHVAMQKFHDAPAAPDASRAHTEEHFSFTAQAPIERVFPLFGADRERVWAPDWNPAFIRPNPAADQPGMVFTVAHYQFTSIWVNTAFDPQSGRVQYVYMIPDHLVTVITLSVKPEGQQTKVDATYERTSLQPEADAHVERMATQDRVSGPEWEKQINAYLEKNAAASVR